MKLRIVMLILLGLLGLGHAQAQDLSGSWVYIEQNERAELTLQHDVRTNRVSGTLGLFGLSLPIEGRAVNGSLIIETMAGQSIVSSDEGIQGQFENGVLTVVIRQPGEDRVTLKMTRTGSAPAQAANNVAPAGDSRTSARAGDFTGQWEATNDDQTEIETVELAAKGETLSGTLQVAERGFFSGRVTVSRILNLEGTLRDGVFTFRIWDSQATPAEGSAGTAQIRSEYLAITVGSSESVYARPGVPLVRSAEGSAEAAALARTITGRIYQITSQSSGRGASIGARRRLAVCSNGRLEYDVSDVATTGALPGGGVDSGSTLTRRGQWSIVLRGGRPVLRAEWQGTGTSYSLTDYFDIRPSPNGRSAIVNGLELPIAGGC